MVRGGKVALIHIPHPAPHPQGPACLLHLGVPSPFQMLPTTGLLEPGQACRIKVTFQPPMAVIYEAQATCWYGRAASRRDGIQLQAVGEARPHPSPEPPPLTSLETKPPVCSCHPHPGLAPKGPPSASALRRAPQALSSLCFLGAADQCSPGNPCLP